jgi:mRNA interferase HigB
MAKKQAADEGEAAELLKNHLISRKKFREFVATHRGTEKDAPVFVRWCKTVEQAIWTTFADVRGTFASADQVEHLTVFNVGGNKYRVIASIRFKEKKGAWVYIKHVLTHREYDGADWKDET